MSYAHSFRAALRKAHGSATDMLKRLDHLSALLRGLRGQWGSAPALTRRAAVIALASAVSLAAFAVLGAVGAVALPGIYPALVGGVLAAGVVVPAASLHFSRERQHAKLRASFADIQPPGETSRTFPVHSLPAYRRTRSAPARLGAALLVMALAAACAGSYATDAMVAARIPLSLLLLILLTAGAAMAATGVAFIVAVRRELAMRKRFCAEVVEGLDAAGYRLAGPFSAEDVSACEVILREKDGDRYWSWALTFNGNRASLLWDASKSRPDGSLWDEYDRRVRLGEDIGALGAAGLRSAA